MSKIFLCCAPQDEGLRDQLEAHLSPLRRQRFIDLLHDQDFGAGTNWEDEVEKHLNEADIILLLISPNFMATDFYDGIKMKRVLERHMRGETLTIPILLRPSTWSDTSLVQLDMLPRNHIPVTEWQDPDEAFCDIARELRYIVENYLINTWEDEGNELYRQGKYDEALTVYGEILQLKNSLAASVGKGNVLNDLQRYEEALHIYEAHMQALSSDRSSLRTKTLIEDSQDYNKKFYEEALQVYEQIFQQRTSYSSHSQWHGMTLEDIPIHTIGALWSAVDRLNQAIRRNPINPFLYHLKGNVFFRLEQYREALGAYEQAIQLQGGFELTRRYFSKALENISQQEYKKFNGLARHDLEKANQIQGRSEK